MDIFITTEVKYGHLEAWPLWKRLYFKLIYRPFFRFSFDYVHIPAQTSIDAHGEICWQEPLGPFGTIEQAIGACHNERCRVEQYTLDEPLSAESVQVPRIYPLAKNPSRYLAPVFPAATPQSSLRGLTKQVENLEKAVGV